MRKNICIVLTAIGIGITMPVVARDFVECVVSTGQNEGFMYNDGNQDRCCLLDRTTCPEISTFSCDGFFNMSGVWSGTARLSIGMGGTDCYINIKPGMYLSDSYDVFAEYRTANDIFFECYSGNYCPGMQLTYTEIKGKYWGSTSIGVIQCPDAPSVFIDSSLTKYATVGNGHILSMPGAAAITSCYLAPGTYYDSTGTYKILDTGTNCAYAQ
ncbi:MAG: hypothetical protein NC311_03400 [Muribaculaceae bacterium]|nr:hypothetical protein [Muribaculaceae bacterium]